MKVVLDSTPLIYLAKIGRLSLLKEAYEELYIPTAVYNETVTMGLERGFFDAKTIQKWIDEKKIEIKKLDEKQTKETKRLIKFAEIETGEAEAIILAQHLKADLILDDAVAQGVAKSIGLEPLWTTSFILKLTHLKILEKEEALEAIKKMVRAGYRISEEVLLELFEILKV